MPYVDKVQVGGTDYDIQDTKAQTEVDELKSAVGNVSDFTYKNADSIDKVLNGNDVVYSIPLMFRLGEVRSQSMYNPPTTDNTRMATQIIKAVKPVVTVTCPTGYKTILSEYKSDGSYNGYHPASTGYTTGTFTETLYDTTRYFMLAIRKTDNSTITLGDVDPSAFVVSFGTIANPINVISNKAYLALYEPFEIEKANFDLSLIGLDDNGYLCRKGTLPSNHINIAWRGEEMNATGFGCKVYLKSAVDNSIRFFFEFATGQKMWANFTVTSEGRASLEWYDMNISSLGSEQLTGTALTLGIEHNVRFNFVGDYVQSYIDGNIVQSRSFLNKSIDTRKPIRIGYGFRGSGANAYFCPIRTSKTGSFASISFDDQLTVLQTLTTNADSYTSFFECPGFDYLLEMHNKYGCKFTLMLFRQWNASNPDFQIENTTTKFKSEFTANSDWLKFGYHGPDSTTYPDTMSVSDLTSNVSTVYSAITNFAGAKCIDRVPRMSMFDCTHEQALALREAGLMVGFLTADDDRATNTGLSGVALSAAQECDYVADYTNDIRYYRTTRRFDNYTAAEILENLNTEWNNPSNNKMLVLFSHDFTASTMQEKLTAVIEWLADHGVKYEFPMNVVI